MDRRTLTRRRALGLGAAALAATGLRPAPVLARADPTVFSLGLDDGAGPARAAASGGWRTLPVTRAPARFDLIGLSWTAGRDVRTAVRARRRGGPWTPWTPLHQAGDHAPDGGARLLGTEPCWTGTAEEFQVRAAGAPRGLTARFVRAKPAAAVAQRLHRRRRATAAQRTPRRADVPEIIPRSAWGGHRFPPKAAVEYSRVDLGFVHHTVSANTYAPEDSAAIVLAICRYHRDHNGWNDIGYNFLVDRYGQVFEGRAGGIDRRWSARRRRATTPSRPARAAIGDHSSVAFTEAGMDALARLLAWKLELHGVPATGRVTVTSAGGSVNRYPAGRRVTLERISGHRDGDATACPGAALYAQLPALRERTADLQGTISPLTITALETTVPTPGTVSLAGTLRFPDGATPAERTLHLIHQPATTGAAWALLTSTTTDVTGAWSATTDVPMSGHVKAVFLGDPATPPVESRPLLITVTPIVALTVSDKRIAARTTVRMAGTVAPFAPATAELLIERKVRGRYYEVKRRTVTVRDGAFRARTKLLSVGRYRITVTAGGARKRRWVTVL
jgi:uncharacterized protein with LGFP repeats